MKYEVWYRKIDYRNCMWCSKCMYKSEVSMIPICAVLNNDARIILDNLAKYSTAYSVKCLKKNNSTLKNNNI